MRLPITALISAFTFIFGLNPARAQNSSVAIGSEVTNPNAVLLLVGNNQGLIIPIVAGKNSVTAGVSEKGMVIFDDSDKKVYCFDGANWNAIGGGGIDVGIPSLFNNQIFVGSTNGAAIPVAISGDVAISNTGTITIVPGAITSSKIASNTITDANISNTANIDGSKIENASLPLTKISGWPTNATGILTNNGAGNLVWSIPGGDLTFAAAGTTGNFTIGAGAVNSAKILNGSITGSDLATDLSLTTTGTITVNTPGILNGNGSGLTSLNATTISSGSMAVARLAPGTNGNVLTTVAGVPTWQNPASIPLDGLTDATVTTPVTGQLLIHDGAGQFRNRSVAGDGTITSTGTLTIANDAINTAKIADGSVTDADIADGSITNTDISATATIAGTKVSPVFGAQNISTTGTLSAGATTVSGLSVSGAATTLNTVGYTWPAVQGAVSTALTNNGTGTLSWTPTLTNVLPNANIFVGNGSNIATPVAMGGDASIASNGTLTIANNAINGVKIVDGSVTDADIADGSITNADISATAAISGRKINPDFGAQAIFGGNGSSIGGARFASSITAGTFSMSIEGGGLGGGGALTLYANIDTDVDGDVFVAANNTQGFKVRGSGNSEIFNAKLGVNRSPITNDLEVAGNASKATAGGWLANSDRRIKTDILDIDNSLEIIKQLRPVKFKYTAEWMKRNPSIKDQYYYNFIAQEYQQLFPESVQGSGEFIAGDKTEILQIDTYNAQIVSIKAIQEQQKIIETQQTQINDLKRELDEIKKYLTAGNATPAKK